MPLEVTLIDHARDPLSKLYGAYRTCYTPKTPGEVWAEIGDGRIAPEAIREFIQERLKTGHASPLEQVVFWFGISGVSRALSHQFVRHRIGISFEQQSQRYVRYKEERLDYVMPKTWRDAHGMADEYDRLMREITRVYELALAKADGSYVRLLAQLARTDVLVLDDWGMTPIREAERRDLNEIMEDRWGNRSTIVTSQIPVAKWHDHIGDPTTADAVCDRILNNAHRVVLRGPSRRKHDDGDGT